MSMEKVIGSEMSLRSRVKAYEKRSREIRADLSSNSDEWGRFQGEFNREINGIFRDLMIFEKQSLADGREEKVYKLKRLFVNRFRQKFAIGPLLKWSLGKPYGYAGDHRIIDDIYKNAPTSSGFERLFDNYFQMSAICNAVRNRKEDFKRVILETIDERKQPMVKIMVLASGPCREIYEALRHPVTNKRNVIFHCYDSDEKAHEYAKNLLSDDARTVFFKQNAVRIALKKDITKSFEGGYDLIYSTGLFDYLDYRVSVRLISNLKKLLNKSGVLAISDVHDKFSNPSIYFMEWVADWNLIYRSSDDFRNIFLDSDFKVEDLTYRYEQQGLMQYIIARNS